MTEAEFAKLYPKSNFKYEHVNSRTRGSHGQTEIDTYKIINISTGEVVTTATRTEHTNLRGLDTTISWE